jgi:xylulokinase
MSDYLMGIDLGTSRIKVAVTDLNGKIVGEGFRNMKIRQSGSGLMDQDPDEYLAGTLDCIREILAKTAVKPARILAFALDGQMGGIIGVDDCFKPLTPYDLVLDVRSQEYSAEIEERCGEAIFRVSSGIWSHAQKILWWKHESSAEYGRIRKFVPLAPFVAGSMAGLNGAEAYTDFTSLFCTGLGDIRRHVWSEELCGELDCDVDKLPTVVEPWQVIGGLAAEPARVCGLLEGTPIAAGSGDQPAGFLGAGIVEPGMAIDVAGSTSVFSICTEQYNPDVEHKKVVIMNAVLPELYYPLSYVNGGGVVLRWFRDQFVPCEQSAGDGSQGDRTDNLDEETSGIAPGSGSLYFIPHFGGRSCPNQPAVRGGWIGLNWTHTYVHMYKAILESIAYDHYGAYQRLLQLFPDLKIRSIRVTGGGSRNPVWNKLKADVLNVPYLQLERTEYATIGSCLIAGHAVGAVADLKSMARRLATEVDRLDPDSDTHELYQGYAQRYERLLIDMDPVWDN